MSVKTVSSQADAANPLGYEKEGKLLVGFAIPCIISMLVTSLYNIVDQIFIGQGVGLLGNAATNIAFPLSIACTAIALLLGIGSATNFSLQLGAGNEKRSAEYAGNGLCLMALFGTVLMAVTLLFLTPMLKFFGATPDVLPYAEAYTRITALGFPFLIMNTGMSKLILADGSPRYSMMSMLIGALINTVLDPLFIFGLDMGMTGAALATILGQIASFCISMRYLFHFKSVPFSRSCFTIDGDRTRKIFSYGASACFNQIAMAVVQIVLNNTLAHYGALSIYGSDIPLACAGIISKVNMIFMSFVIGISQGVLKKVRDEMFAHMQKLPIRYFDTHTHGDLMSHFTNDVDTVQEAMNNSFAMIIQSFLTLFGTITMMMVLSVKLTMLVVVFLVITFLFMQYNGKCSKKYLS